MANSTDHIVVVGAKEHNLKGVDLTLPRDSLVVITGLSGSGKSSLAFDTIYQEGQRRFLESLSSYARQFLGSMEKPDVERVEGLSPTLCIDQKTVNRNPRSTVGTITEILDHLRLLMARLGTARCPVCHRALAASSPDQIATAILRDHDGAKLHVMAPIVQARKGEYRKELAEALAEGWLRARIDGTVRRLDEPMDLERYEKHTIELVVDRIKVRQAQRPRLVEAIERALERADGVVSLLIQPPGADPADATHQIVSSSRTCPDHGVSVPELEPRLFSFNAPQGMCPSCSGIGWQEDFDLSLLVRPEARLDQCIGPLEEDTKIPFSAVNRDVVKAICRRLGVSVSARLADVDEKVADALLFGADIQYAFTREREGRKAKSTRTWAGLIPTVRTVWRYTYLQRLKKYRRRVTCPACKGQRLHPVALAVDFRGHNIADYTAMTVRQARDLFSELVLEPRQRLIGEPILRELNGRLGFLDQVGLDYLSLDRSAATLSGGEAQRIRLAAQVGAGLQGVTYVLDEPSIGLHGRDQARLLDALTALRDKGNSVIVVEHDAATMDRADWLVEVGPGAGRQGGQVVASGTPGRFRKSKALTARYLRGEVSIPVPETRRSGSGAAIVLSGAAANNLQSVDFTLPLGTFTVVTGVSGSGKSTLVDQTLTRALARALHGAKPHPGAHRDLAGLEHIDKVIRIDQAPIGRTPRSNPATYTKVFGHIRDLFAQLPESRARGWAKGRFSFNVKGGRCEACQGAGVVTVEMQFLADVQVPCEDCAGKRFNRETLEVAYRGRTISDILHLTVAEALEFFRRHKRIRRTLQTLVDVGLDYIQLGQPSTTLSGGEAQRIKLASELSRPATGRTLYILDEPTTGLHMADVGRLLDALGRLVDAGNTVLVIEHNTDVIKVADHIVDLGPDGGAQGGRIVGAGTPELIATLDTPTGRLLRELLPAEDLPAAQLAAAPPAPRYRRRPRRARRDRTISLRGVHTHNLRGIDVDIPEGKLVVVTGPSGSGKTSLAFDTLFAEGQRRYVESLSTYARRFLGRLQRPPVDKAEGLAPAIAIDQRNRGGNPRSTVATTTEVQDALRLLYARVGKPHCPRCARPLAARSPTRAARALAEADPGPGWLLCTVPEGTRIDDLISDGFARAWDDTTDRQLDLEDLDTATADGALMGERLLVVDRFNPARVPPDRAAESIATAYGWGGDRCQFRPRAQDTQRLIFSRRPDCPEHGTVLPSEITPRHFSFNAHVGACPGCDGLGRRSEVDPERVLPRPEEPLADALDPKVSAVVFRSPRTRAVLRAVLGRAGLHLDTPVADWPSAVRAQVLRGTPDPVDVQYARSWGTTKTELSERVEWGGVIGIVEGWSGKSPRLRRETVCSACGGGRLQPWLLAITIGDRAPSPGTPPGTPIHAATAMTVSESLEFWQGLELGSADALIAEQVVREMTGRLHFLQDVGLGYLTLDRRADTLSGGELQRIRLATQLGSRLTGTIYVLDEPTIGLHPRDTARLLKTLRDLQELGNTLVVVEHDPMVMTRADHLIDMGPGAGEQGGTIVAQGTPAEVATSGSLTGAFLSGARAIATPTRRRAPSGWITPPKATLHNLQEVEARFPRACLTVVTGVSGSGKSTLVMAHLGPWLAARQDRKPPPGAPAPPRVVVVNQRPIGRTPRSTPATYCNVWDPIRKCFAQTRLSRERGWTASRYSWNTAGGRCEHCEGRGAVQVEMHFLSDVWMDCEHCEGRRFNRETLAVTWREHSIADVLSLSVDAAAALFANQRTIHRRLRALSDVGLGYLRLGQPATTLSGGEAQRLKLANELVARRRETVFLLDEPTTGLHLADVEKLLQVLHRLVDQGHSAVVIEHHIDVIRNADHVIDMGPEGGDQGGQVLATGTPEAVAGHPSSHTGQALRDATAGPTG